MILGDWRDGIVRDDDWVHVTRLQAGLAEIIARYPDAELAKNQVGNLTIAESTAHDAPQIGHWNLRTGEVEWWEASDDD